MSGCRRHQHRDGAAAGAARTCGALQRLTRADVQRVAGGVLGGAEIDAVIARRALIVSRFETLIAARGEAAVLY
jgi:hypothetical protein